MNKHELIKKYDTGYTQVLNSLLNDKKISLKAKGLYAYLFSKPDGWEFHISAMVTELKETKGQIYSVIKELITAGYITRYQQNENGVFGGIVYEFRNPYEKPCTDFSAYGQTPTHNNKDILNKKDNNIYIQEFEEFWKYYPKQRAGSKSKAYTSFCRAIKEKRITIERLLAVVKKYATSKEVEKGFAKGCAAWLNDDRFNQDYEQTESEQWASDIDNYVARWNRGIK